MWQKAGCAAAACGSRFEKKAESAFEAVFSCAKQWFFVRVLYYATCCHLVRHLIHAVGTWGYSVSGSGSTGFGVRWWWTIIFHVLMENLLSTFFSYRRK